MKPFTMQPTFTEDVPLHSDEVDDADSQGNSVCSDLGSMSIRRAASSISESIRRERRFWSPHLNVQVIEVESESQLYCRFSPRPEVWTMFMFIYFIAAFLASAAAIYGYVQWFLGETPWALVIIPIAIVTIVSLHAASLFGQGLSSDQMDELRQRFDRMLKQILAEDQTEGNE